MVSSGCLNPLESGSAQRNMITANQLKYIAHFLGWGQHNQQIDYDVELKANMACITCLNSIALNNDCWILVTGVTNHMFSRKHLRDDIRSWNSRIQMPNGSHSMVVGIVTFLFG